MGREDDPGRRFEDTSCKRSGERGKGGAEPAAGSLSPVLDSLDGIVVSNPDADHIGGFLDVFDAFPVETVFVSGDTNSTLTYNTFLRGVRDEGAQMEILRTGMLMDWGGVRADVIGPPTDAEGGLFSEINDNSVAILLTYGTARILLAGDAEANEEEYMANGQYTGPLTMVRV